MGKVLTTSKSSPVNGRSSLHNKFSTTALSLALATVFSSVSLPADAAGLGRLTVNSGLGQPLRAEVEVTSLTDNEASSLKARLARPEAFRQAGLEFNPALTGLRFDVQRQGAGAIVKITSSRPVNEPFVDLLIELNWNSGKFVREYTFLLDPPELRVGQPQPIEGGASQSSVVTPSQAPNSAIAPAAARVPGTAQPQQTAADLAAQVRAERAAAAATAAVDATAAAPAPVAQVTQPTPAPAAPIANPPTARIVQRGDTLAVIAKELQPEASSLNQAMVAIYRKNESAFFGSVHQLRAGVTLDMPSQDEINAVTSAEAVSEMQASNEAWREYRARLAEAAADSTDTSPAVAESNAAIGTIGSANEETGASEAASDELKLSRDSSSATSSAATATGEAAAAQESDFAREAAVRNAQGRVSELERNVADLQRLLELKNKQLADLGNQVTDLETAKEEAAASATGTVTEVTPAADSSADTAVDTEAEIAAETAEAATMTALPDVETVAETAADAVDAVGETASETVEAATDAAETASDSASETLAEAESAVADSVGQTTDAAINAATQAAEAAGQAVAPTTPEPSSAPTVAPVAKTESMVDTVMNTVTANPIVPVGAAALIAIGGFFAWRRRKSKKTEDRFEDTLGGDDAFAANSLFGTTGGQDVDTSNSLFNTGVATDSAVDVHSTEVDPIAEAEVYIAYGREAQAEEILKEALKRQPDRQAIRLKLLEIYAGRKDSAAYGAVAREMYDATGGQNEEWPKVITMGLAVDPENPLYTGDTDDALSPGVGAAAVAGAAGVVGSAGLVDALSADSQTSPSPMTDAINTSFQSLSSEAQEVSESITAAEPDAIEAELDDDMNSLDFDLDINTEIDTQMPVSDDSSNLNAALEANVEMPSLEMDVDTEGNVAAAASVRDDLSVEIPSLDTMRGQIGNEAVDADLASVGLELSSEADAAPSGDGAKWQEMATKLDLASAYEEIGDKEGARELLDEVLKDGDNAQQQKARAMLSKIS